MCFQRFADQLAYTHVEVVSNNIAALEFLFSTGKYRHRSSVSLPTLVLLDMHLSQQNNFDLLQVINCYNRTSKLLLIVFTESAREALTAARYGTDVHHSIQKPIRADALRDAIQAIKD
jgi:CheY-like chemotaxis protein